MPFLHAWRQAPPQWSVPNHLQWFHVCSFPSLFVLEGSAFNGPNLKRVLCVDPQFTGSPTPTRWFPTLCGGFVCVCFLSFLCGVWVPQLSIGTSLKKERKNRITKCWPPKFWGPAALGLGVANALQWSRRAALGLGVANALRWSRFLLCFRFLVLGWLLNNRTNATAKKHWAPIVYTPLAGYSYRRGDSPSVYSTLRAYNIWRSYSVQAYP